MKCKGRSFGWKQRSLKCKESIVRLEAALDEVQGAIAVGEIGGRLIWIRGDRGIASRGAIASLGGIEELDVRSRLGELAKGRW